jgi:hypothetical protein
MTRSKHESAFGRVFISKGKKWLIHPLLTR